MGGAVARPACARVTGCADGAQARRTLAFLKKASSSTLPDCVTRAAMDGGSQAMTKGGG